MKLRISKAFSLIDTNGEVRHFEEGEVVEVEDIDPVLMKKLKKADAFADTGSTEPEPEQEQKPEGEPEQKPEEKPEPEKADKPKK